MEKHGGGGELKKHRRKKDPGTFEKRIALLTFR